MYYMFIQLYRGVLAKKEKMQTSSGTAVALI